MIERGDALARYTVSLEFWWDYDAIDVILRQLDCKILGSYLLILSY
jgi:hypothetical protein